MGAYAKVRVTEQDLRGLVRQLNRRSSFKMSVDSNASNLGRRNRGEDFA
jgi:hypothetical protein